MDQMMWHKNRELNTDRTKNHGTQGMLSQLASHISNFLNIEKVLRKSG